MDKNTPTETVRERLKEIGAIESALQEMEEAREPINVDTLYSRVEGISESPGKQLRGFCQKYLDGWLKAEQE